MSKLLAAVATAAFVASLPTVSLACCGAQAFDLVWPWDGMEDVPVDAAIILYGNTWEQPLGEWTLYIESESGEPVPFSASVDTMVGDYFLIVAVPDEELAPDTEYKGTLTLVGAEAGPREFGFSTGTGDSQQATALAPEVSYQGLGVPMIDAEGVGCISSVTEEAGALAMTITGAGLADRPILVEARDSQEKKVFDILLSGKLDLEGQLILGGDLCRAHFEVDPCEHYCVRAAALDLHGQPGSWSEWSCSEDIGYWVCGDPEGEVLFGEGIPEGMKPSEEVQACSAKGDPAPEAGGADNAGSSGLPESNEPAADDDSGAGCAVGAVPAATPWGMTLLALLVLLPVVVIGKRRSIRTMSGFLSVLLLATGCGGPKEASDAMADQRSMGDVGAGDVAAIDPADLSPDALIFAIGRGGGFMQSPEQIFFVEHHGDFALHVFGDRRVVRLDQSTIPELGYRVFRQSVVPEDTFIGLLALAAEVKEEDGGEYQRCPASDGPTESLFVGLPGLAVQATCFSSFAGWPDCEGPEDWETPPPEALAALHAELTKLKELPGEILVTDGILLGGYAGDEPSAEKNCDETNAVAWTVMDVPAFPENEPYNFWTLVLDGAQATQVRDFVRANVDSLLTYSPSACVSRDGKFYRVFYDDMLPGEEGFPF